MTSLRTFYIAAWLLCLAGWSSCDLQKMQRNEQTTRLKQQGFVPVVYQNGTTTLAAFAKITNKPKLLFVHGFGADGVLQWTETARLLSQSYDIILPDLVYHGGSETTNTEYSLEFQVTQLHDLMTHLGANSDITLIGSSYGGAVSAMYATKYPQEVKKLILNDAVTPFFSKAMAAQAAHDLGAKDVMALLAPTTPEGSDITMRVVYYNPPHIPRFLKKTISKATQHNRENREKMLLYLMDNEEKYRTYPYQLNCPVYLIWGANDPLIPVSTAVQAMAAWHIPSDHLTIIPKTAHVPNLERKQAFHTALQHFLNHE